MSKSKPDKKLWHLSERTRTVWTLTEQCSVEDRLECILPYLLRDCAFGVPDHVLYEAQLVAATKKDQGTAWVTRILLHSLSDQLHKHTLKK